MSKYLSNIIIISILILAVIKVPGAIEESYTWKKVIYAMSTLIIALEGYRIFTKTKEKANSEDN